MYEGGHEFVSLLISQHRTVDNIVIATYYYGESLQNSFRFRFYEFNEEVPFFYYFPTCNYQKYLAAIFLVCYRL